MSQLNVAIVGGGLVGALEACLLAKRGFQVTLFESRHDGRNEPTYYGRSINLAISVRGISALERLGLDHIVRDRAIPIKARMIHDKSGKLNQIPYDPHGRCINSIERASLSNFLLDTAEREFNVKILFNHKLVDMNADRGELLFRLRDKREWDKEHDTDEDSAKSLQLIKYRFDLILGCDGSRSTVRSVLARQTKMDMSQSYIEHGYLELRIDPEMHVGGFRMAPNYLHIWPRGNHMMIALPNKDCSFTCTLFMPHDMLKSIQDPESGLQFFTKNFPDSVDLIGESRIRQTLSSVEPSPLISIKCSPYVYKGKIALLGDAAHAMVPFYGQGMNCGFEDCLVLDELLDEYMPPSDQAFTHVQLERVLAHYNNIRCVNGHSMCDLAMYNYIEIRDLVNTWSFMFRKKLDNVLYHLFPNKWIPLYTMVAFSRIPVDECARLRASQDRIISRCLKLVGSGALLTVAVVSALIIKRTKLAPLFTVQSKQTLKLFHL